MGGGLHSMKDAIEFFLANAGYSYDPKTETPEEGRLRCATGLAEAEAWAHQVDLDFVWEQDIDGAEALNEHGHFEVYDAEVCSAILLGDCLAMLCGIIAPSAGYRRVAEAELACEARENIPGAARAQRAHADALEALA